MGVWRLEYIEVGDMLDYRSELFFSAAAKSAAIDLFCRLGGDDILKVTVPFGLDRVWRRKTHVASELSRPT
jgi:hypothetical protein